MRDFRGFALMFAMGAHLCAQRLACQERFSNASAPVESLLSARRFRDASRAARQIAKAFPEEPQAWILVAQSLLSDPLSGSNQRLQGLLAIRRALALDSNNTPAWAWYARAGLDLGGADGERIADEGLRHVLASRPFYPGAWDNWLILYRGPRQRERMRLILTPFASDPTIATRLAQLLIEDADYAKADSVLGSLVNEDSAPQGCAWALLAQSAFESGRESTGWVAYQRALREAADGRDCLWRQIAGIASPVEARQFASVPPESLAAFLGHFWAVRNPDLFAATNQRVAEHFRRLQYARVHYPLLHPLNAYNRSVIGRGAEARPTIGEQMFYQRCEARATPGAPLNAYDRARDLGSDTLGGYLWNPLYNPSGRLHADLASGHNSTAGALAPGSLYLDPATVRLVSIPHGRDVRDLDSSIAPLGYNLVTGLDDRGLTYLRFGQPSQLFIGSDNADDPFCRIPDLERWVYPGVGTVRFFRPNAVFVGLSGGVAQTGDMVYRPMGSGQFEATAQALSSDETSLPAPLEFGFWTAQFRNTEATELLVIGTRGVVRATLSGSTEHDALTTGSAVILRARPGRYRLLVHARVGDSLGRQEADVRVRGFNDKGLSDLLLGSAEQRAPATRQEMILATRRDLTFDSSETIRAYAEVYGLRGSSGTITLQASYLIARTTNPRLDLRRDSLVPVIQLVFDRVYPAGADAVPEWLDIVPRELRQGQYLLRLEIRDSAGRRLGLSQIVFSIR